MNQKGMDEEIRLLKRRLHPYLNWGKWNPLDPMILLLMFLSPEEIWLGEEELLQALLNSGSMLLVTQPKQGGLLNKRRRGGEILGDRGDPGRYRVKPLYETEHLCPHLPKTASSGRKKRGRPPKSKMGPKGRGQGRAPHPEPRAPTSTDDLFSESDVCGMLLDPCLDGEEVEVEAEAQAQVQVQTDPETIMFRGDQGSDLELSLSKIKIIPATKVEEEGFEGLPKVKEDLPNRPPVGGLVGNPPEIKEEPEAFGLTVSPGPLGEPWTDGGQPGALAEEGRQARVTQGRVAESEDHHETRESFRERPREEGEGEGEEPGKEMDEEDDEEDEDEEEADEDEEEEEEEEGKVTPGPIQADHPIPALRLLGRMRDKSYCWVILSMLATDFVYLLEILPQIYNRVGRARRRLVQGFDNRDISGYLRRDAAYFLLQGPLARLHPEVTRSIRFDQKGLVRHPSLFHVMAHILLSGYLPHQPKMGSQVGILEAFLEKELVRMIKNPALSLDSLYYGLPSQGIHSLATILKQAGTLLEENRADDFVDYLIRQENLRQQLEQSRSLVGLQRDFGTFVLPDDLDPWSHYPYLPGSLYPFPQGLRMSTLLTHLAEDEQQGPELRMILLVLQTLRLLRLRVVVGNIDDSGTRLLATSSPISDQGPPTWVIGYSGQRKVYFGVHLLYKRAACTLRHPRETCPHPPMTPEQLALMRVGRTNLALEPAGPPNPFAQGRYPRPAGFDDFGGLSEDHERSEPFRPAETFGSRENGGVSDPPEPPGFCGMFREHPDGAPCSAGLEGLTLYQAEGGPLGQDQEKRGKQKKQPAPPRPRAQRTSSLPNLSPQGRMRRTLSASSHKNPPIIEMVDGVIKRGPGRPSKERKLAEEAFLRSRQYQVPPSSSAFSSTSSYSTNLSSFLATAASYSTSPSLLNPGSLSTLQEYPDRSLADSPLSRSPPPPNFTLAPDEFNIWSEELPSDPLDLHALGMN